jgi:hypothetical protein
MKIKQTCQVLHFSAGDFDTALDEIEEMMFELSLNSGDWDADHPFTVPNLKMLTHSMEEAIKQFHTDTMSEAVHISFTGLSHTEEFQATYSFWRQPFLWLPTGTSTDL